MKIRCKIKIKGREVYGVRINKILNLARQLTLLRQSEKSKHDMEDVRWFRASLQHSQVRAAAVYDLLPRADWRSNKAAYSHTEHWK